MSTENNTAMSQGASPSATPLPVEAWPVEWTIGLLYATMGAAGIETFKAVMALGLPSLYEDRVLVEVPGGELRDALGLETSSQVAHRLNNLGSKGVLGRVPGEGSGGGAVPLRRIVLPDIELSPMSLKCVEAAISSGTSAAMVVRAERISGSVVPADGTTLIPVDGTSSSVVLANGTSEDVIPGNGITLVPANGTSNQELIPSHGIVPADGTTLKGRSASEMNDVTPVVNSENAPSRNIKTGHNIGTTNQTLNGAYIEEKRKEKSISSLSSLSVLEDGKDEGRSGTDDADAPALPKADRPLNELADADLVSLYRGRILRKMRSVDKFAHTATSQEAFVQAARAIQSIDPSATFKDLKKRVVEEKRRAMEEKKRELETDDDRAAEGALLVSGTLYATALYGADGTLVDIFEEEADGADPAAAPSNRKPGPEYYNGPYFELLDRDPDGAARACFRFPKHLVPHVLDDYLKVMGSPDAPKPDRETEERLAEERGMTHEEWEAALAKDLWVVGKMLPNASIRLVS